MLRALVIIGWLNAAIWLGGSLYFSLVAAPSVFQPAMKRVFNDYQVGVVAQLMLERYFLFQVICASVALAQFSATETTFTHGGKTMPVNNWWYSMQAAQMQPNVTAMMEGLQFFSDRFITYPFINEKYSMAEYGSRSSIASQVFSASSYLPCRA